MKCFICSEEHVVTKCQNFFKPTDREKLLKENKICIYCVKHKYDYKKPCNSRSKSKCQTCGGQHITAMHPSPEKATIDQSLVSHATLFKNPLEEYFSKDEVSEKFTKNTRFMATALVSFYRGHKHSRKRASTTSHAACLISAVKNPS